MSHSFMIENLIDIRKSLGKEDIEKLSEGSEDAIITSAYTLHIAQNFYRVGSYKTYDEVTNYTVKKLDCDCRQCLQYKKTENSQGRFSYETVETNECEVESKCSCYDCQKENFDNSDSVFFEENQKYTCTFCDRSFTWFGNFQKHIFKHKGTERVENAISSLQGKYQNYVIRDTSSSLRCGVCFKSFTRLSTLRIHIRMHNGERPFTCEKCDISFTTNRALKMHLRIHSNFRPFKCNLCTKTFTRKDELKAHSYAHTGEKPFKCENCGSGFVRQGHLQRHMLIHAPVKPYQCKLCPKSFTQYRNLQTHIYKHTGERPYRCKFCNKGFTQYGTLQAHERTHTGTKPYPCTQCERRFITSSHLRWHVKRHHTKDENGTETGSMKPHRESKSKNSDN